MKTLLSIDTATDALSLAFQNEAGTRSIHRVMPRKHHQQLFEVMDELLDGESLRDLSLDGIIYGKGPGSFTGLRIAVSAAQGMAYSLGVPLVGVSTLEALAATLCAQTDVVVGDEILTMLDARIEQVYAQGYRRTEIGVEALNDAAIMTPAALALQVSTGRAPQHVVGNGLAIADVASIFDDLKAQCWSDVLPEAAMMLPIGEALLEHGAVEDPVDAHPDYVQQRVGWKTLAEQGKKA
ncbi:MAG: tRNA (adenosine(37)-N6)-threonylcarbamoyltransferase complex dimerization subunit type 1 TsaB [Pseudomonadota bacterium]